MFLANFEVLCESWVMNGSIRQEVSRGIGDDFVNINGHTKYIPGKGV
jgi:hypothetical protein